MKNLYGAIFIIIGFIILVSKNPSMNRPNAPEEFRVYFGIFKWVFGPLLIAVGTGFIIVNSQNAEGEPFESLVLKCPNCGEVAEKDNQSEYNCESCNSVMEELEGFFERHPRFKD